MYIQASNRQFKAALFQNKIIQYIGEGNDRGTSSKGIKRETVMHLKKSDLKKVCREFLTASWEVFSWRWDSRFEALVSEFSADDRDEFRAVLERDLSLVWDSSNIREAPDIVKVCNDNFGGLQSGQLLFTSDPNQDIFIFGAWWPWGDGETISLRITSPAK
jgi:hypothetical protein